ncbi:hypothetical protein [Thermogemmatispora tikiterensis]|uniref:Uncharacterized protein n=1 Tax=Thermogemmatispora tikiterensis TaxID=1825093 RepID=A0A328VK12_9CHLR|nr:hypothetical protein [Thermogemmatispora tikiterensis]RAQ95943.1 hypothetical protein A4R35_10390 [Thermogemmatispora tikiterensis]
MQMDWKRFSLLLLAGFSLEVLATATSATVLLSGALRVGEILVVLLILGMAMPRFLSWLYQRGQQLVSLHRWSIRRAPGQKALVPSEELADFLKEVEKLAQSAQGSSKVQGEALARLLTLCGVAQGDEPHIQLTPWALYQFKHWLRELREVEQYEQYQRQRLHFQICQLNMRLVQLVPAMDHPGLLLLRGQMQVIQQLSASYPSDPLLRLVQQLGAELEQLCQQISRS